jgi:hypothetical protein
MLPSSTTPFRTLAKGSVTALLTSLAIVSCSDTDDGDGDGGAGRAGTGGSSGTSGSAGTGGTIIGAGTGGIAPGQSDMRLADPCRGIGLSENEHHVATGLCVRAVAIAQGQLRQISFT